MLTLDQGIIKSIEIMTDSYRQFYKQMKPLVGGPGMTKFHEEYIQKFIDTTKVSKGSKYVKVVADGSVKFFIVSRATAKFKVGDLLMPSSYSAPATNFARGNVCDNQFDRICWTGVS